MKFEGTSAEPKTDSTSAGKLVAAPCSTISVMIMLSSTHSGLTTSHKHPQVTSTTSRNEFAVPTDFMRPFAKAA